MVSHKEISIRDKGLLSTSGWGHVDTITEKTHYKFYVYILLSNKSYINNNLFELKNTIEILFVALFFPGGHSYFSHGYANWRFLGSLLLVGGPFADSNRHYVMSQ